MFRRKSRDYTFAYTAMRTHMRASFALLRRSKTSPELAMRTSLRAKLCSLHVRNTSCEFAMRTHKRSKHCSLHVRNTSCELAMRTHMRSKHCSLHVRNTSCELAMRTHVRSKHCSLHVRNTSCEFAMRTQHYKEVLFQHSLRRADLSHNTNYRETSRLSYGERFSDNSLTYYDKYRASLVLRSWRSRSRFAGPNFPLASLFSPRPVEQGGRPNRPPPFQAPLLPSARASFVGNCFSALPTIDALAPRENTKTRYVLLLLRCSSLFNFCCVVAI